MNYGEKASEQIQELIDDHNLSQMHDPASLSTKKPFDKNSPYAKIEPGSLSWETVKVLIDGKDDNEAAEIVSQFWNGDVRLTHGGKSIEQTQKLIDDHNLNRRYFR